MDFSFDTGFDPLTELRRIRNLLNAEIHSRTSMTDGIPGEKAAISREEAVCFPPPRPTSLEKPENEIGRRDEGNPQERRLGNRPVLPSLFGRITDTEYPFGAPLETPALPPGRQDSPTSHRRISETGKSGAELPAQENSPASYRKNTSLRHDGTMSTSSRPEETDGLLSENPEERSQLNAIHRLDAKHRLPDSSNLESHRKRSNPRNKEPEMARIEEKYHDREAALTHDETKRWTRSGMIALGIGWFGFCVGTGLFIHGQTGGDAWASSTGIRIGFSGLGIVVLRQIILQLRQMR